MYEPSIEFRIDAATDTLTDYQFHRMEPADDMQEAITDLATDLLHLARSNGLDTAAITRMAETHYVAETLTDQEAAPPMERIKIVCSKCGSQNVRRNCDAAWDTEYQMWEIASMYDHCDCEDCGGECNIEEIPA